MTHTEIAAAIGAAIGPFADTSAEQFAGSLRSLGMPPWQVDGLLEDYAHYQGVGKELVGRTGVEPVTSTL